MKRRKKKNTFWKILGFLFFVFFIFTLGHFVWHFLGSWEYFNVNKIEIQGTKIIPEERLSEILGFKKGENIFSYKIPRALYEKEKWIEKISIVRDLPDRIIVKVKERQPLALARAGAQNLVVTVDGIVIKLADEKIPDLPVWENFNKENFEKAHSFVLNLRRKETEFFNRIKSFSFDGKDFSCFYENFKVFLGRFDEDDFKQKIEALKKLSASFSDKISYADFRGWTKERQSAIIKTVE